MSLQTGSRHTTELKRETHAAQCNANAKDQYQINPIYTLKEKSLGKYMFVKLYVPVV